MADTDVLDMLFDSSNGILGVGMEQEHQLSSTLPPTTPVMNLGDNDLDWNSLLFNSELDDNGFFKDIMDTNLSDDSKFKEKQLQPKFSSDHAYSATPGSPHSDSGISNGPSSPSSSSNGAEAEQVPFDLEQELFGPLNLETYTDIAEVDPMMTETWSDSSSSSPTMNNDNSSTSFDFADLLDQDPGQPVNDLTISTDETTKVIKVLSVNNSNRRSQSLLTTSANKSSVRSSPYQELTLSDEEKNLLRKEGISLPTHMPLTREEEKLLRSVRRRIRNKASARNSRKKKQDYMEALEERVKLCTEEKRQLEKKVNALEKQNSSLIGQLRKLQKMVSESTKQTAKTGTCAMILALSFALVLLPNFQSLMGGGSAEEALVKSSAGGRPSRSLLSKPEDIINMEPQDDTSTNYLPFFNLNKMAPTVSPVKQMVAEPVDGLDKAYAHEAVDARPPDDESDGGSRVIHMEITKLPDQVGPVVALTANESYVDVKPISPDRLVRHRSFKMDVDGEL